MFRDSSHPSTSGCLSMVMGQCVPQIEPKTQIARRSRRHTRGSILSKAARSLDSTFFTNGMTQSSRLHQPSPPLAISFNVLVSRPKDFISIGWIFVLLSIVCPAYASSLCMAKRSIGMVLASGCLDGRGEVGNRRKPEDECAFGPNDKSNRVTLTSFVRKWFNPVK